MDRKPYIGVTGFTSRAEVDAALAAFADCGRPLMVGVLASQKTLAGGERNARSPAPEDIERIFPDDPRCLNLVHYFTKALRYVDGLEDQITSALRAGGPCCDGIQLNCPEFPRPSALEFFRQVFPTKRLVLQVRPCLTERAEVSRLRPLVPHITDILIDSSGGQALSLSELAVRCYVGWYREAFPELGIGVAGGLCAETLAPALTRILAADPGTSFDAEGRLHTIANTLDLDAVRAYLAAAGNLLKGQG